MKFNAKKYKLLKEELRFLEDAIKSSEEIINNLKPQGINDFTQITYARHRRLLNDREKCLNKISTMNTIKRN